MSRQIAIINIREIRDYDHDSFKTIIASSITDWSEVSDEEYQLLTQYSWRGKFTIVERLDITKDFVGTTVQEYKEMAKKEKAREDKEEKDRLKKKKERAAAKAAKQAANEKALFEKLKAQFEGKSK